MSDMDDVRRVPQNPETIGYEEWYIVLANAVNALLQKVGELDDQLNP